MAVNKNPEIKNQDGYFCDYGYWHSHTPNAETIAAFEETEEIIKRIKAGDRTGCMSLEDFLADLYSKDEGDDEI